MRLPTLALGTVLACCQCSTAHAAIRVATLDVSNMSCVTCPLTVKAALKRVPGVSKIQVDFETRRALVTFDDARTDTAALLKATADVGFPASVAK